MSTIGQASEVAADRGMGALVVCMVATLSQAS